MTRYFLHVTLAPDKLGGPEPVAQTKLSPKQERFVQEFLVCLNSAEAARRAGYSGDAHALAVTGSRNLQIPKIATIVRKKQDEFAAGLDLNVQYVLHRLKGAVDQYIDIPEHAQHGLRALEDIAKYLGMFVEKREIVGEVKLSRVEIVKDYGDTQVIDGIAKVVEDGNSTPN